MFTLQDAISRAVDALETLTRWMKIDVERARIELAALNEKMTETTNTIHDSFGLSSTDAIKAFEELGEYMDCYSDFLWGCWDFYIDDVSLPPHRYGAKLREKREGTSKHASYNYIPQAHRNLPYMRRRYS